MCIRDSRTAGSKAERLTGEMLAKEMESLGLTVTRDAFTLDGWDFHHAILSYQDMNGLQFEAQLGAYQTQFDTHGPQTFTLINAGRGTREELELSLIHI